MQQFEACFEQALQLDLAAQLGLTIVALYEKGMETAQSGLERTKELLAHGRESRRVSSSLGEAIIVAIQALEGKSDFALAGLKRLDQGPASNEYRDACLLARFALFLLSRSPHNFNEQDKLREFFSSSSQALR